MRVTVQDKSFVGNKLAIASTSTIGIDTGGGIKEANFCGDDKARHAHDLILWNVLNTK